MLARHPERVASLTLLCPAALDHTALRPLSGRLLIITGDQGPGALRVQAALPALPEAETAVLRGYAGLTWSDLAAERGGELPRLPSGSFGRRAVARLGSFGEIVPARVGDGSGTQAIQTGIGFVRGKCLDPRHRPTLRPG